MIRVRSLRAATFEFFLNVAGCNIGDVGVFFGTPVKCATVGRGTPMILCVSSAALDKCLDGQDFKERRCQGIVLAPRLNALRSDFANFTW